MRKWLKDLSAKKWRLQQKNIETLKPKDLKFEVQNSPDRIKSNLELTKKRGVSEYEGRPKDITFEKEKTN